MAEGLSTFEQAFKEARAQGMQTFDFHGRSFTTETKEEQDARQLELQPGPEGGVNRSQLLSPGPGAAQQSLQQSPAGQVIGQAAQVGKTGALDLLSQISDSARSIFAGQEGEVAANVPALAGVQSSFQQADQQAATQGLDLVERDVFRHKQGSREATIEHGFLAALLGGQGHEANTLVGTAKRVFQGQPFDKTSLTGQILSPGRFFAESMQDSINNLIGQAEGIISQLGLETDLGSVSIDRSGTTAESAGASLESGINKLAGLVTLFQEKLAEAKGSTNGNPESQVQASRGTGQAPNQRQPV